MDVGSSPLQGKQALRATAAPWRPHARIAHKNDKNGTCASPLSSARIRGAQARQRIPPDRRLRKLVSCALLFSAHGSVVRGVRSGSVQPYSLRTCERGPSLARDGVQGQGG
jgi:hypothetical protein